MINKFINNLLGKIVVNHCVLDIIYHKSYKSDNPQTGFLKVFVADFAEIGKVVVPISSSLPDGIRQEQRASTGIEKV